MADKLLFIGDAAGFEGGIERYAWQSAGALRRRGFEVWFAGRRPGRDEAAFRAGFDRTVPLREALSRAGEFRLAALHKPLDAGILKSLAGAFAGRLVFWAHDHDAYCPRRHYYTPWGRSNCRRPWGRLHCSLCTLPETACALFGRRKAPGLSAFRERFEILRRLPAVVLSEFMRGNLLANGFADEHIRRIPPFIEPSGPTRRAVVGGRLRLLFVGQLIRGKGADLLLRLLALLDFPFRAVVAGDGKDRPALEKLAGRLSLRDRIEFTGWHARPEALYREADLAVLPFRWQEPFGLTGLEAAAHGVPVVAFDLGGVREWLRDEWNGLLAPPRDIAALARAVTRLNDRPELREAMGGNGVRLAEERFSRKGFLRQMDALIGALP